jgi:hypothetical protein
VLHGNSFYDLIGPSVLKFVSGHKESGSAVPSRVMASRSSPLVNCEITVVRSGCTFERANTVSIIRRDAHHSAGKMVASAALQTHTHLPLLDLLLAYCRYFY